jgi:hypothetical protein
MRSVVCSLICSFRSNFNVLAYQAVRQSQLCRTSNILSPMIRRLRELERRKKKKRMVTVDETGLIAVDGFEVSKEQWSRLIPAILSRCESILSSLLVGEDWRLVMDVKNVVSVAADFSFQFATNDRLKCALSLKLVEPVDHHLLDQLCSFIELCFHGLGLGSLRYIELERMEISRCIWHRSTIYFDGVRG